MASLEILPILSIIFFLFAVYLLRFTGYDIHARDFVESDLTQKLTLKKSNE